MQAFFIGDTIHVRDKRDGQIAIQSAELLSLAEDTATIKVIDDSVLAGATITVPLSCVQPYVASTWPKRDDGSNMTIGEMTPGQRREQIAASTRRIFG